MNRRSVFRPGLLFGIACIVYLCCPAGAQTDGAAWWRERPPRIYHPNMRAVEAEDFDVKRFIADCKALHAEAVVFSAGGMYAFYDTQLPNHVKSPYLNGRDLLGEVIEEASANGIKVIARLDFSKARRGLFAEHPGWFQLGPDGEPVASRGEDFYDTALLGGYQNEEFAIPVLEELLSRYAISGVHLNAPGFRGRGFDEETLRQHGIPAEGRARDLWREQMVANQMKRYREVIHRYNPEALFMAEINAPENPGWGSSRGYNHQLLAEAYTNLLSTCGEPADEDLYRMRWWVALAADTNRAAGAPDSGLPIVNLKAGFQKGKLALKPVEEYAFYCYQAAAHNAGIKAPTYGLLQNMPDARTASMIGDVFEFMERCEPYLASTEPIAPVALVWPGREQERDGGEPLREELLGLYRGLISRHILFELLPANRVPERLGGRYHVLVLPSAALLDAQGLEAAIAFMRQGGRLVLTDCRPDEPVPQSLARVLGGTWDGKPYRSAYAVPAVSPGGSDASPGPIPLSRDLRPVVPADGARVWWYSSSTPEGDFVPEEFPVLEKGDRAVLFSARIGNGQAVYCAGGLGAMMWDADLPDYSAVLEAMIYPDSPAERPLATDAPSTVNITAYRTEAGTVAHLVNGTGKTPLDEVVPVGPIRIRFRGLTAGRARWHAPGKEPVVLDCRSESGDATVVVPRLDAYGLLVLETSRNVSTAADKLSLVRFDCNDYSVPVRFAHHPVLVKGYVDLVRICSKDEVIAEHGRLWDKEEIAFKPIHYLELLERKPGALDHARPLCDWGLPESFSLLRSRLEQEGQARGTREFIRVLRLLEKHPIDKVAKAIEKALRLRRCNRDVVAQYLYPDEPFSPATFLLDGREHLQGIWVDVLDLTAYQGLLGGRALQGGRN